MSEQNRVCRVCGYHFINEPIDENKGGIECPFCGTIHKIFEDRQFFSIQKHLTDAYDNIRKGEFKKASDNFSDYKNDRNNEEDNDYVFGKALCDLKISVHTRGKKLFVCLYNNKAIGERVSDYNKSYENIKGINTRVYDKIEYINKNDQNNLIPDAIIAIYKGIEKAETIRRNLEDCFGETVIALNIEDDYADVELMLYKNIQDSKGLLVFGLDDDDFDNVYFRTVYKRMLLDGKKIAIKVQDKKILPLDIREETFVFNDFEDNIYEEISSYFSSGKTESKDNGCIIEGTTVKGFSSDEVDIPNRCIEVVERCAKGDRNITKATIHIRDNFIIKEKAFMDCTKLETVTFAGKKGVLRIHRDAFKGCKVLRYVNFDESLKEKSTVILDKCAFRDCRNLNNFRGFDCIKAIPKQCFSGCGFNELTLPRNITEIGEYAFEDNEYLEKVRINSNTDVNEGAFAGCKNMNEVTFYDENQKGEVSFAMNSFPKNCKITFEGKELKNAFKKAKKEYKEYYQIDFKD